MRFFADNRFGVEQDYIAETAELNNALPGENSVKVSAGSAQRK